MWTGHFSGPMLNILGIGLLGSWVVHITQKLYHFKLSTTFLVSTIGLLFLLLATPIFVLLNRYCLTYGSIVLCIVIMTINVIVKVKKLNWWLKQPDNDCDMMKLTFMLPDAFFLFLWMLFTILFLFYIRVIMLSSCCISQSIQMSLINYSMV